MITVKNYEEKKDTINWKTMPAAVNNSRSDTESIMEFYNDDKDIKEAVDMYLSLINENQSGSDKDVQKSSPKPHLVIYNEGRFLTRKTTTSDYSFTDNENFAYTWEDSDRAAAEKVAKPYDGLVVTMKEALKLNALANESKANREKKQVPEILIKAGTTVYNTVDILKNPKGSEFEVASDFYKGDKEVSVRCCNDGRYIKQKLYVKESQITLKKPSTAKEEKETLQDVFLASKNVRAYMPKAQQMAVLGYDESEEVQFFIDKIKELEENFSKAHKMQDNSRTIDSMVFAHYFYGNTHWYISEIHEKEKEVFCYVILNGDDQNSEAGYSSITEILSIKGVELDFYFKPEILGKILHKYNPDYFDKYEPITAKKEAPKKAKVKVAPVLDKKIVDGFSNEFLLIRRFWNVIKSKELLVPFRTVQLLYMAFNKAAVERKVRKSSDVSKLFEECNKKIITLFENFDNPEQKPYKVTFSDQNLYNEIKEYATGNVVNPAIAVLKRMIAIQNTLPDVKKAETLLKAVNKIIDTNKANRLSAELEQAKVALEKYIKKPAAGIEPKFYGLSRPRSVCTNRIKCAGIDKSGKLHKGYKFEEHTGHIIKVRSKKTVSKKKAPLKKKVAAGLGYSGDNYLFEGVERIYTQNKPVIHVLPKIIEPKIIVPNAKEDHGTHEVEVIEEDKPAVVENSLMAMQFDSLEMDEGWENLMQEPGKNMKIAIWGAPKNGKTAGALKLASYLTKFGKVLYNFVDQGFNKSTQDLWVMSGLSEKRNAVPSDVATLDELEELIKKGNFTFVFIDMISDYIRNEKIKPEEFKARFMKKYPKVSFILIFEVTKGGNFKGDQGWTHLVDAIMTVEDFLIENRGRYGTGSHIVWEEGLKRFNPKKYEQVMQELAPAQSLEFNEVERI